MTTFETTIKEIAEGYVLQATDWRSELHICSDYEDFDICEGCQMLDHGFKLLNMIGDLTILDNFR